MGMSNAAAKSPVRLITCTRPRCAAYQVIRYLDGAKLLLTASARGRIRMYELHIDADNVERPRKLDADGAAAGLERAIAAGYNVVQISIELEQRARASSKRRSARCLP